MTESGTIFYSGMHSKFRPEKFPVGYRAKSIFATYDSVGIIGEDQKVYYLNDQFIDDSDAVGNYLVSDDETLKNGVV